MKKSGVLVSLMTIAAAVTLIAVATMATFSDQVRTGDMTFTAGTLFMSVDGECGDRVYGGQPGDPGVDGNEGCTLSTTVAVGPIAPGDPAWEHTFEIVNEGNLDGLLTATVTTPTIDPGHPDCDASNFIVNTDTLTDAPLAAGENTTFDVSVALDEAAPNVCQGAELTLSITFDLVQA